VPLRVCLKGAFLAIAHRAERPLAEMMRGAHRRWVGGQAHINFGTVVVGTIPVERSLGLALTIQHCAAGYDGNRYDAGCYGYLHVGKRCWSTLARQHDEAEAEQERDDEVRAATTVICWV